MGFSLVPRANRGVLAAADRYAGKEREGERERERERESRVYCLTCLIFMDGSQEFSNI